MNREKLLIIGFGNQAKAWALNLKDSGKKPVIGLRKNSQSFASVKALGIDAIDIESNELSLFEQVVLLTPDDTHHIILENLSNKLNKNTLVIYAHGYSMLAFELNKKYPQFQHVLLAPKAIASELRFQFETGGKLGAVYGLEYISDDNKEEVKKDLFELALGIGITAGPYVF
jgi:ketol-acid reductoisomerase